MKSKLNPTVRTLSITLTPAFSFTCCSSTDTGSNVKMHEMGGNKSGYSMQDKDMPCRNN